MFNPLSDEQAETLRATIAECDLTPWETEILALAQTAIRFEPVSEVSQSSASSETAAPASLSRFGGLPDVPPGWSWPENVRFYAQVDLAQLAPCDLNRRLPPAGLLSFFASDEIEAADLGLLCQVFYFPDVSVLKRATAPRGFLPVELNLGGENVIYRAQPVTPFAQITLPTTYSSAMRALGESIDSDRFSELQSRLEPPPVILVFNHRGFDFKEHQVLGHHGFVDGDMAEVVGLSAAELEQDEWVLLLQLESDGIMGWNFWDAGRFLFAIAAQDLKNQRFDCVRGGLWTS